MSPSLQQIRAFLTVARCGTFTKAADAMRLSQPALTVQIRLLEERLGYAVFDRTTRSVHLTRLGRELLPKLERLQRDFDDVFSSSERSAAGEIGSVRIACLPSVASSLLPDAISAFRTSRPDVNFVLKDAPWQRVIAMVRSDDVDFGIGDMMLGEDGLQFEEIYQDRLQVVFPAGHAVQDLPSLSLQSLRSFPLILFDRETSMRPVIDAVLGRSGPVPPSACDVMQMSTAVAMVRAGLGVAILAASASDWRAHPELRVRLIDDQSAVRSVGLIRRVGRSLPPASAAFVDALRRIRGQGRSPEGEIGERKSRTSRPAARAIRERR